MTGNGSKTLRSYDVRGARGEWLALVVTRDDGYFSTVSDYGNYAYFWSHAGECFRRFLCGLDRDYLCSKIAPERVFYGTETEKSIKREILARRHARSLSRDDAREEWDLLEEHDVTTREGFAMWWQDTKLDDAHEHSVYGFEPQALAFADEVWPRLAEMLRAELAAERDAA